MSESKLSVWRIDDGGERFWVIAAGDLYVAEYELAAWFDSTMHRARQTRELGAHRSLEKMQAACARHARNLKKASDAA